MTSLRDRGRGIDADGTEGKMERRVINKTVTNRMKLVKTRSVVIQTLQIFPLGVARTMLQECLRGGLALVGDATVEEIGALRWR